MSELAFDANGEPITFPANAHELRVRRFRNPGMRGACEIVHDQDGAPLYVPVDITYLELRKLVDGIAGRYRLDPVDAERKILAAPAAYVTITEPPRNAGLGHGEDRETVLRELVHANAEMVKTIADRFANVMQAAAELLRAADGAGLPKREPMALPPPDEVDDDDEDYDDEPDELSALVSQILPTIQMWLASRAKASAAAPAAGSSPAAALAPPSAHEAAVGAAAAPVATEPAAGARPGRNAAPVMPTPEQIGHLLAIQRVLAPQEAAVAQAAIMRMDDQTRAAWLAQLTELEVEQAAEIVRSMLPRLKPQDGEDVPG